LAPAQPDTETNFPCLYDNAIHIIATETLRPYRYYITDKAENEIMEIDSANRAETV